MLRGVGGGSGGGGKSGRTRNETEKDKEDRDSQTGRREYYWTGVVFRWAPSKNPSVIRNNKDPPAPSLPYPLPRQSFTLAGGHRSSQWPSYPSTPATCPGNDHRPGLALVFSIASASSLSARHPTEENKHTPTPPSICTPIRLAAYAQHRRIPSARVTLRCEIVPSHSLNVPDPPPRFLTIVRCVVLFFKPFPFSLLASPCDRLFYTVFYVSLRVGPRFWNRYLN